ncbi:hypothetical protein C0995_004565, partial [Termitomyces sp. Mi166
MAIELELSVPMVALQPIMNPAPMPVSTTSSIHLGTLLLLQECSSQQPAPQNKGKGKAKAMEDDDDDKETAQKLRKELEEFVAPTT